MNVSDNQITEIFFHLDEFQQEFELVLQQKAIIKRQSEQIVTWQGK